jgi:hypothetical protein
MTGSEEYKTARAQLEDELRAQNAADGTTKRAVKLPGGQHVANVSLSSPEAKMAIDDEAMLAWVAKWFPTEVEMYTPAPTRRVRSAFRGLLIDRVKLDVETGRIVDVETGEVVEWARVVPAGPGSMTLGFEKQGRGWIREAWQSGDLALTDLIAIGRGGDAVGPTTITGEVVDQTD